MQVKMAASHIGLQYSALVPEFSFLLMQTLGDRGDGSSDCVPATHMGDLD